jgi:hypothetical protein
MVNVNWDPDPQETAARLAPMIRRADEPQRWAELLRMAETKELDTWDYQYIVDSILKGHLTVIPRVPLSRNRGFGVNSTHTAIHEPFFSRPIGELPLPLNHPKTVRRSAVMDELRSLGTLPPRSPLYAKLRPYGQEIRKRALREGADLLGTHQPGQS